MAGIILSNADDNTVGGTSSTSQNVISGNSLDGILLVNDAECNAIHFNEIGTDPSGVGAVPNSADGIFLLGASAGHRFDPGRAVQRDGAASSPDNTISDNLISGNGEDGIQIFGSGAPSNTVLSNTIGLAADGASPLAERGKQGERRLPEQRRRRQCHRARSATRT